MNLVKKIRICRYLIDTSAQWHSDDEKAKDDWIGSVGRAIVRCSSTYVSRGGQTQGGGDGGHAAQTHDGDEDSDDYSNSSNNPYFND